MGIKSSTIGKIVTFSCRVLIIGLYLYHFFIVRKYAVNVPYWDEWEYFRPEALPSGLTWNWIFKFHNEHRIVLTKLLAWLNLQFFGLDFSLQQTVNFVFFGFLLFAVYLLKKRVAGVVGFPYFLMFMIFLLSPLNYENHLWAFQSQFHLVLLFSLLALTIAFPFRITALSVTGFSLLTIVAMFTFSAGVVVSIVYSICFFIYIIRNCIHHQLSAKLTLYSFGTVCILTGTALILWFHGYHRPPLHPELVMPFTVKFWDFFLGLTGFGFGYVSTSTIVSRIIGLLSLLCVFLPIVMLLTDRKTRWAPSTWTLVSGIGAILALLATIAMARAEIEVPTVSRYNEFASMLIPFASLVWWLALQQSSWRSICLSLLWLFCFIGYFDKSSFAIYAEVNSQRNEALECIVHYNAGAGDGVCPMTYDVPINSFLDQAKQMPVRFIKDAH